MLQSEIGYIWWPLAFFKQLPSDWPQADLYMTFDLNNALHFGQGFFLPNLVATGHKLFDPGRPPAGPLTPAMHYTLVRGSSYFFLLAIGHS